ncbi:MAG: ATP-binding cassette domain-containing protein [candidate division WOR-3 bacterium]|nr:ATP-binding cassette domain-containing protein [candidate division WOR-3 bacterium]MCX7947797.1 ATP-binding cassette domain-containing protein [candidate division WOR-3 bacterium]MDW8150754.1 ATP-binding cassette domain-containing protein [candidate division WOR-3 bacterium]
MIKLKNISKSFGDKKVLENVNFEVNKGDFIFIIGETGIGKTTLLKLLYLEEFADSGEVYIFEKLIRKDMKMKEIQDLRKKIGVIFQDYKILPNRTVYENVVLPLRYMGLSKSVSEERVEFALKITKLIDKKNDYPYYLSGGEQQRISIARAVARQPEILIADEPTGNLDINTSTEILKILIDLNFQGMTVIIATHDLELLNYYEKSKVYKIENFKLIKISQ